MKYIIAIGVPVALVACHNAWSSVECPLLLSLGALVCVILKVRSNEQRKKKSAE